MSAASAIAPPGACVNCKLLSELVDELDALRAPASLDWMRDRLGSLSLCRADIDCITRFSESGYRRTVIRSSPWYELLLICWRPGQRSAIHDHAGCACVFRVIEGGGVELQYGPPESGVVRRVGDARLSVGDVCASVDDDIHEIVNDEQPPSDLITLHLYSPKLRMNVYRAVDA